LGRLTRFTVKTLAKTASTGGFAVVNSKDFPEIFGRNLKVAATCRWLRPAAITTVCALPFALHQLTQRSQNSLRRVFNCLRCDRKLHRADRRTRHWADRHQLHSSRTDSI